MARVKQIRRKTQCKRRGWISLIKDEVEFTRVAGLKNKEPNGSLRLRFTTSAQDLHNVRASLFAPYSFSKETTPLHLYNLLPSIEICVISCATVD